MPYMHVTYHIITKKHFDICSLGCVTNSEIQTIQLLGHIVTYRSTYYDASIIEKIIYSRLTRMSFFVILSHFNWNHKAM